MALYLGAGNKIKVNLNGKIYNINLQSAQPAAERLLLSLDGYALSDSDGVSLTVQEDK